jgi:AMIN domain
MMCELFASFFMNNSSSSIGKEVMSRIHDALKSRRQVIPDNRKPEEGTDPLGQSAEIKQLQGSSRNKGSTPSGASPLFHADPEENIRLWMQKYFPGVSLSREEAIHEWLAKPPESRVYGFLEVPMKGETGKSDIPAAAPQEVTNKFQSNQAKSDGVYRRSERAPRFIPGGEESLHSERSRNLPKLIFRLAAYAVLALLVIRLLWAAIPMIHVAPHADSSKTASQSERVGSGEVAQVPASLVRDGVAAPPTEVSTQPSRVESLSIGCKNTEPCIEINTGGKEIVPRLNTLSNPDRLVVDFHDASYSSDIHRIAVGRGVVKDVRIRGAASAEPPNTRVVVDLAAKCDFDLHALKNRFVLNLYPKGAARQSN